MIEVSGSWQAGEKKGKERLRLRRKVAGMFVITDDWPSRSCRLPAPHSFLPPRQLAIHLCPRHAALSQVSRKLTKRQFPLRVRSSCSHIVPARLRRTPAFCCAYLSVASLHCMARMVDWPLKQTHRKAQGSTRDLSRPRSNAHLGGALSGS